MHAAICGFLSHVSRVFGSLIVPSPLSINCWACAAPIHNNVAHIAINAELVFLMRLPPTVWDLWTRPRHVTGEVPLSKC